MEGVIKYSAAAIYSGGADTVRLYNWIVSITDDDSSQSVSSIHGFFLVMMLHPEVQRKAQAEIDRVVGKDRLPDFADRDNLPYVEAVVKELIRYHTVIPAGAYSLNARS